VADYSVVFARSASKELRSLDAALALRILKRIESLSSNPRPPGIVKLEGSRDLWRVRVGDWRVIYRIVDRECLVDVISVRHRREAYR
jgi:mRNA interferase RelE/StbE